MTYQLLRDYYLVWVDQIWESSTTKSGIITSNTAIQNNVEELEDRGEFKRRYGWVQEVPASFSDQMVELVDPGMPQPRRYVGHDWIQRMRIAQRRGYRQWENPQKKYYPSTFEQYETVKMSDLRKKMDIVQGEKVYFDHKSTDLERYMGKYKDGHMFSVRADEIHCAIREVSVFEGYGKYKQKRICMQGGWVLVKVDMEDWKDITTPSGIIFKVAPEALPLRGKIVSSQRDWKGTVLFEKDADAPITVEGQELTCMKEDDILATIKN